MFKWSILNEWHGSVQWQRSSLNYIRHPYCVIQMLSNISIANTFSSLQTKILKMYINRVFQYFFSFISKTYTFYLHFMFEINHHSHIFKNHIFVFVFFIVALKMCLWIDCHFNKFFFYCLFALVFITFIIFYSMSDVIVISEIHHSIFTYFFWKRNHSRILCTFNLICSFFFFRKCILYVIYDWSFIKKTPI